MKPADLNLSTIHRRTGSTAAGIAMPPLAKNLVDTAGLQLLSDWINSLDPAIGPTGPVTGTPPRDASTPVLTLTSVGATSPVSGPFTVTLTASEPIVGLTAADLTVVNATVSNPADRGRNWTFTVTPLAAGAGSVTIRSDRVTDANGNANPALASPLAFTYQPPAGPVNLLTNGGFESGLDGWDRGGLGDDDEHGLSRPVRGLGRRLDLDRAQRPGDGAGQPRLPRMDRGVGPGVRAEAGLTFWDANGVWIEDRTLVIEPGTSWQSFQLAFTAPVGARNVSVWFLTNGSGGIRLDEPRGRSRRIGNAAPVFGPGMTISSKTRL